MVGTASTSAWGTWHTEGLVRANCGPQSWHPPSPTQVTGPTPSGNNNTETVPDEYNQCIFVRCYTMRRRTLVFPTVIRTAGPHDLGPGSCYDKKSTAETHDSDSGSDTVSNSLDDYRDDDRSSVTNIDAESDIVIHNITVVYSFQSLSAIPARSDQPAIERKGWF